MRISDWSSDVCSSDLGGDAALARAPSGLAVYRQGRRRDGDDPGTRGRDRRLPHRSGVVLGAAGPGLPRVHGAVAGPAGGRGAGVRDVPWLPDHGGIPGGDGGVRALIPRVDGRAVGAVVWSGFSGAWTMVATGFQ